MSLDYGGHLRQNMTIPLKSSDRDTTVESEFIEVNENRL